MRTKIINKKDQELIQAFLKKKKIGYCEVKKHERQVVSGRTKELNKLYRFLSFEEFVWRLIDGKSDFQDTYHAVKLKAVLEQLIKKKIHL